MIFPQIIRQKLLKGVGESSFLTPFSESFSFNFPHFTFFISTDSSSPFLFSCSLSVLTVIFTYFQLFPPFFQPFSIRRFFYLHFFTIFKTDFPSSRSPSLSHTCAICLISSQIHRLYYYYYFYIFLFLFFFCNFTSFLHPFSKTLFISFNQPFPEQPAPLWK